MNGWQALRNEGARRSAGAKQAKLMRQIASFGTKNENGEAKTGLK